MMRTFFLSSLLSFSCLSHTLIVIRHGQSLSNTLNVNNANPQRSVAFPLTKLGEQQVRDAAAKLKKEHPDLVKNIAWVYTSPVHRAQQTADILIAGLGLDVAKKVTDYAITETGYGDNEGKNADHERNKDRMFATSHFAETERETAQRVDTFVKRMKAVHANETILVVTHGTPMGIMVDAPLPKNAEFRVLKSS